jgi:hypothetical protein
VPAEQRLRRFVHRRGVQALREVPDAAGIEGRPRRAVQDAVAVAAPDGGEAGGEALRRAGGAQHGDGVRAGVEVQRLAHPFRRQVGGDVDLRDLALGVHAGVGAAGGDGGGRGAAVQMGGGGLDHRLDGEAVLLALPADEGRAVVFQQQGVGGHVSRRRPMAGARRRAEG